VEGNAPSSIHFRICNDNEKRKQTPQINDNRDKNKSQRIGEFSLKIDLFWHPNKYLYEECVVEKSTAPSDRRRYVPACFGIF